MGSIFNHMNKKDKIIIDVNSNYDKVRLVLTAKVVREGGVAIAYLRCPGGGIGRHKGFKIPRRSRCAGSSPARGTIIHLRIISFDKAPWQSGYAADCKSVDLGSIPGGASIRI